MGGLALTGTAAFAKPVYFYKAAVDRQVFIADVLDCNQLAGGVRTPHYGVYSPNLAAAAAGALFAGFFESRERHGIIENVLRTCMTDKGYRRVEASPDLNRELRKLPETARLERLFVLASAERPAGTVLPW